LLLFFKPFKQKPLMKINLLKISGLSMLFLLHNPAFSKDAAWASARKSLANEALRLKIQVQKNLTGTVLDEKSTPLPGVVVRNTTTGKSASTDANGRFSISATEGDMISFTFIGYVTQTQTVGAQSNLSITLIPSNIDLKEVAVVGIGYGTQNKDQVPSAVSHVGPEDFRQSGSRNPLDLIQGKVAGLQIT